jgi:hypothetical protein
MFYVRYDAQMITGKERCFMAGEKVYIYLCVCAALMHELRCSLSSCVLGRSRHLPLAGVVVVMKIKKIVVRSKKGAIRDWLDCDDGGDGMEVSHGG